MSDEYTEYLRKTAALAQSTQAVHAEMSALLREMEAAPGTEQLHQQVVEAQNLPEGLTMANR
jgi:uncharacterized coiled-coil DUF342 family protein